ncbi:YMD3-like protein [Mya arenaria]|uniref:YMD3-like protein n=1 Tax=Mya arenaria TaxID=6604 RepID=A0ABY7G4Y3_MYAAR|nr:YMD3-like protein [Mya arenaria]
MFAKATKRPYGYLMVDLKPFTPDNQRLMCVTSEQYVDKEHVSEPVHHVTSPETINKEQIPPNRHSSVGIQTVHIVEENMDKGPACDDCGQLFESGHDVQRHVKSDWCPERREQKKRNHDEISDDEDDSMEDNESFIQLLIEDRDQSDDAHKQTEERMQPYNEKAFFDKYTTLIDTFMLPLRNNGLHKKIMARIDALISKGMNSTVAVKRVLRKHKNSFQDLFDMDMSDEEGEDSDSEEESQEFKAKKVQDLMKKDEIHYFPTQNETKASTSERAILTIKTRLMRYFSYKETSSFLPVLQDIAENYNNTYHRTIGMTPADVKDGNQEEVRLSTYFAQNPKHKQINTKLRPFKFKVGAFVQISHLRTVFTRAYDETYSGEVFKVHKRYHRGTIPINRLVDLQDEEIKGTFYQSELQKVNYDPDQSFKIVKILKTKGRGQHKQYFVKWKFYPKKIQ